MIEHDLRGVVDALRARLVEAAMRHTKDIPAADCMLYAEASGALGSLLDALEDDSRKSPAKSRNSPC